MNVVNWIFDKVYLLDTFKYKSNLYNKKMDDKVHVYSSK